MVITINDTRSKSMTDLKISRPAHGKEKKDGETLISMRGWWCVYARKLLLHVSVDEQDVQSLKYCHLHTFKKPQYFESNARDISKV